MANREWRADELRELCDMDAGVLSPRVYCDSSAHCMRSSRPPSVTMTARALMFAGICNVSSKRCFDSGCWLAGSWQWSRSQNSDSSRLMRP